MSICQETWRSKSLDSVNIHSVTIYLPLIFTVDTAQNTFFGPDTDVDFAPYPRLGKVGQRTLEETG